MFVSYANKAMCCIEEDAKDTNSKESDLADVFNSDEEDPIEDDQTIERQQVDLFSAFFNATTCTHQYCLFLACPYRKLKMIK